MSALSASIVPLAMPTIRPRPNRPSLYPDWSTLVYAFDGRSMVAPKDKQALLSLITHVSLDANLCLSFAHLLELLRGTDRAIRSDRAAWLDSLDVVWLRDLDEVNDAELERVLRRSVGLDVEPLELPAVPTFLAQFRNWTPIKVGDVLLKGTVSDFVRAVGDSPTVRRQLEQFSDRGAFWNRQMFADFKRAVDELGADSGDEVRSRLREKLEHALRLRMIKLNQQLVLQHKPGYALRKGEFWVPPDAEVAQAALSSLDALEKDLPSTACFYEVVWAARDIAGRKASASSSFFQNPSRKGDTFDWWHLLGAAYCDVFVCDARTSECLGSIRSRLARAKEVVFRDNDLSKLEQEIRTQLRL